MKNKILLIFLISILFTSKFVFAASNDAMEMQKENFGISTFINETEKYTTDFLNKNDISNMINNAISGKVDNKTIYSKILNLFGKEVISSTKTIASILVIIVIHSILKSISDSLESKSVSQIIYYVQYILIVTVIMANFADIIQMVKDTANNLVGFMNILVPLLLTLMMYTGNIATTSIVEPIILLMINILGNCINLILIPAVLIITILSIVSKISDKIQINKLAKLLNSSIIWFLGICLTLFVATISLEGTLSSSVDGITAKTVKAAASTAIPVVGKILRRCSRYCAGMWSNFKKCYRNGWSNNYSRNLYSSNNQNSAQ